MKKNILFILSLIIVVLSCQNKNPNKRIDIKYINYTMESVSGPKWEEIINGKHSAFLVKSSITNEGVYDSILCIVNSLKPMNKATIPEKSYPYMQCVIHYPDGHTSVLILGGWYNSLDGVAMVDNDSLVKMLHRYSGYNHPPR